MEDERVYQEAEMVSLENGRVSLEIRGYLWKMREYL